MGQVPALALPDGLLELAAALEAEWPARTAALHASGVPLNKGEETETETETATETETKTETETEDEAKTFDAAYVKKLRDEAAKHRKDAQEARALVKQREDLDKTDAQKAEDRAAAAEKLAATSTSDLARLRVALKKGLTESQAKRLVGDTEEDLEKDADELLASFKTEDSGQEPRRTPRERLRPGAA